jgi:hypothetical protein
LEWLELTRNVIAGIQGLRDGEPKCYSLAAQRGEKMVQAREEREGDL